MILTVKYSLSYLVDVFFFSVEFTLSQFLEYQYVNFYFPVLQACWWSMLLGETRHTWARCWTVHGMTGLPPGKKPVHFILKQVLHTIKFTGMCCKCHGKKKKRIHN